MRGLLLVVAVGGALIGAAGLVTGSTALAVEGFAVALAALGVRTAMAVWPAAPRVRWPLLAALAVLALVVVTEGARPHRPVAGFRVLVSGPLPPERDLVLGVIGDDLRLLWAPLLAYACLVAAVAALPRRRRTPLAWIGAAGALLAVGVASRTWLADGRWLTGRGPTPLESLAVQAVPLAFALLALVGAVLAGQRGPGRMAPALAAAGMLVLAVPALWMLSSTGYRAAVGHAFATRPADALVAGLIYAAPAARDPGLSPGSVALIAAWVAGAGLVVLGCLRATRAPADPR